MDCSKKGFQCPVEWTDSYIVILVVWQLYIGIVLFDVMGLHPSLEYNQCPLQKRWQRLLNLCVCAAVSGQAFWLIWLGNNASFLFSLFLSYQRKEHCKILAYYMNYCIHLFILGKVDFSDACSQKNACSQQPAQRSWGSSDLVNRHRSLLLLSKLNGTVFAVLPWRGKGQWK